MLSTCILLLCVSTFEHGPFSSSGSFQLQVGVDTMFGTKQSTPAKIVRLSLTPQFSLYGLPLWFSLFLTTEDENIRQQISQFALSFQPDRLISAVPGVPEFLLSFPNLVIGAGYPEFSEFTLSSSRVNGVSFDYAFKKIYFGFARGELDRAVSGSPDSADVSYKRVIRGYKLGFGNPQGSHLHFIYVHAWDDPTSITPPSLVYDSDTAEAITPMENFIVGMGFGLNLGGFAFNGEISASEVTSDTRLPVLETELIPSWALKMFKPRLSSYFDYAVKGELALNIKSTNIKLGGKMIGPGYESFGAPNLRNDLLQASLQVGTQMWQNQVSLNISLQGERDNLIDTKGVTTWLYNSHMDISLTKAMWPMISAYGDMFLQSSDDGNTFRTTIVGFTAGYGYMLKNYNMMSQISLNYQRSDQPDTAHQNSQSFYMVMLNHSVTFRFPLTVTTNLGYSHFSLLNGVDEQWNVDLSASYNLDRISPSLGITFLSGSSLSQLGVYSNVGFELPYGFRLSTQISSYKSTETANGTEQKVSQFKFMMTLTKSW